MIFAKLKYDVYFQNQTCVSPTRVKMVEFAKKLMVFLFAAAQLLMLAHFVNVSFLQIDVCIFTLPSQNTQIISIDFQNLVLLRKAYFLRYFCTFFKGAWLGETYLRKSGIIGYLFRIIGRPKGRMESFRLLKFFLMIVN